MSFAEYWSYSFYFMSENISVLAVTKVQNSKIYIDFKVQKQTTSHISFTQITERELFLCTSS